MWTLGANFLYSVLQLPLLAIKDEIADTVPLDLAATALPSYVLEYAPLVWLYSQEAYLPYDFGKQLVHAIPMVNWTAIQGAPSPLTLDNLASLNDLGNTSVYLTSKEGINANPQPEWLHGVKPDANGKTEGAVSSAIIVRDHGNGTLDAFYFYCYAYNQGNTVLGMEFGDHVGDLEHNMMRFENGVPKALWYSQHAGGEAFTYSATEKKGKRPIAYSANGTHAVYAIPGTHDHAIPHFNLPVGFVEDHTDRGTLWDPIQSAYAYSYDAARRTFQPYDRSFPVNWLGFNGQWGDDALPGGPELFGEAKYTAGPNGPKFKHLVRETVCSDSPCVVLPFRTWSEGEMVGEE
ncbi:vacuolar protein sorting-associated protein 62 [Aspergillus heteromorphus CBS 117.55]|uniref:Vacuolar protein sorting-associated protein 62 n=1 Tax=Aspergillus heteromorphus CBS 117.55 TaxID=1448321 RepID=A0A317X2U6_9EURO|nr:vacuolar protein sorting-associated protein 62 [Aspergillus heteromorphus CBS 117.55]PWY92886.1 vacuolar protein sorting-associated protein 62 [Aspergillus heteromorphus CBS 117.55]